MFTTLLIANAIVLLGWLMREMDQGDTGLAAAGVVVWLSLYIAAPSVLLPVAATASILITAAHLRLLRIDRSAVVIAAPMTAKAAASCGYDVTGFVVPASAGNARNSKRRWPMPCNATA